MISSIILLKTALDALPLLSQVQHHCWGQAFTFLYLIWYNDELVIQVLKEAKSCLLGNVYKSICENEKYTSIRNR